MPRLATYVSYCVMMPSSSSWLPTNWPYAGFTTDGIIKPWTPAWRCMASGWTSFGSGTGSPDARPQTGGQLRSALRTRRQGLGHDGNFVGYGQETRGQFLSLHSRSCQRRQENDVPGGADQSTSQNVRSQPIMGQQVTVPRFIEQIPL